jgi:hypothetical protein
MSYARKGVGELELFVGENTCSSPSCRFFLELPRVCGLPMPSACLLRLPTPVTPATLGASKITPGSFTTRLGLRGVVLLGLSVLTAQFLIVSLLFSPPPSTLVSIVGAPHSPSESSSSILCSSASAALSAAADMNELRDSCMGGRSCGVTPVATGILVGDAGDIGVGETAPLPATGLPISALARRLRWEGGLAEFNGE